MSEPGPIAGCFGQLSQELHELNSFTEAEFLAVGERLQSISRQCRELANLSSQTAELLDGQEFSGAIDGLRRVLAGVERIERGSETNRQILAAMLSQVNQTGKLLAGFSRLVLHLKVLALHTRIESARVRDADTDFDSLGDEVATLAVDIQNNSENIEEGSRGVQLLMRGTLARLDELGERQRTQISALVRDVKAGLDSLTDNHAHAAEAAAGIAARYETVCRQIGDVVRSLQFQDITRQQVEHVREALEDANRLMRERGEDSPDGISLAASAASLQTAQLRNSRDTLVEAVERMIAALRSVAEAVREISALPVSLAGAAEQQGGSFLEAMQERLGAVAADLGQYARSSSDVRAAIAQVVPAIEKMSGQAGAIEAIGFHLGMVALNAQVKTAHIGTAGAALGVLAGNIQELTGDTTARTASVAEHLRQLSAEADALRKDSLAAEGEDMPGGASGDLDSLAAEIGQRISKITGLNGVMTAQLTALATTGTELRVRIEETCTGIKSHQRAAEVFGQALSNLEESVRTLKRRLPASYKPPATENLDWQKSRYTMHSERQVHGSLQGDAAAGEQPAPITTKEGKHDDLGDNVELF
ncbi:MAG TPA: methyl-accepting chemotaxis protein [Bryobacteraceae bacterium]|nr:methyl-accepting chemotaxis protein [Bryobacteraceae bacterium]